LVSIQSTTQPWIITPKQGSHELFFHNPELQLSAEFVKHNHHGVHYWMDVVGKSLNKVTQGRLSCEHISGRFFVAGTVDLRHPLEF
jgi:hypothetical protein